MVFAECLSRNSQILFNRVKLAGETKGNFQGQGEGSSGN